MEEFSHPTTTSKTKNKKKDFPPSNEETGKDSVKSHGRFVTAVSHSPFPLYKSILLLLP